MGARRSSGYRAAGSRDGGGLTRTRACSSVQARWQCLLEFGKRPHNLRTVPSRGLAILGPPYPPDCASHRSDSNGSPLERWSSERVTLFVGSQRESRRFWISLASLGGWLVRSRADASDH